ncbi:hypothetical protein PFISCL1PPCAC_20945, partial [Pristionchus fissidentatus]
FQMTSQPDLTIRWEIEEIDQMVDGSVKESPAYFASGLMWKVVAKKEGRVVNIRLNCDCEREQTNWNCDAEVNANAFHESGTTAKRSRFEKFRDSIRSTAEAFTFRDAALEAGYAKDGTSTVEFSIFINHVVGIRELPVLSDFSTPDHLSNVILVV